MAYPFLRSLCIDESLDFIPIDTNLTFSPELPPVMCVDIVIIDDAVFEPNEIFLVQLLSPNVTVIKGPLSETAVTIVDDDGMVTHPRYHEMADHNILNCSPPGPQVTFLDPPYQVLEEAGTLEVCFNVTRNGYLDDLDYTFVGASAQGISMRC